MIRFLRLRKLNEFKITEVYSRNAVHRKTHMAVSDMTKKFYSLLLILTLIKKVHAFQKFMSLLITIAAINYEEMLKKDLASKYLLEVNVLVIITNPPSVINLMLPSLFLEFVIIYP